MKLIVNSKFSTAKIFNGDFDFDSNCQLHLASNAYLLYVNLDKRGGLDIFNALEKAFHIELNAPKLSVDKAGFFQASKIKSEKPDTSFSLDNLFSDLPLPKPIQNHKLDQANILCFWLEFEISSSSLFSKIIDIGYDKNSKLQLIAELDNLTSDKSHAELISSSTYYINLPDIKIVDTFNFENLTLKYHLEKGKSSQFFIEGKIVVHLSKNHPFSFEGYIESNKENFKCAMHSDGEVKISSLFSNNNLPEISFTQLTLSINYTYKTKTPKKDASGVYQVSVMTKLKLSKKEIDIKGAISLKDARPIMVLIEIHDDGKTVISIADIFNSFFGGNIWPASLININLMKGSALYYLSEKQPNKLVLLDRDGNIDSKSSLTSLTYQKGFNIYAKFILTLIDDFKFEGHVSISQKGALGEIIYDQDINILIVQLIKPSEGGGGPKLILNSSKKSIGIKCGVKFFQQKIVDDVQLSIEKTQKKAIKLSGMLHLKDTFGLLCKEGVKLNFSYDKYNGFKLSGWENFNLKNDKIKFIEKAKEQLNKNTGKCDSIAAIFTKNIESKFSISPSFKMKNKDLYLELHGIVKFMALKEEITKLNFPQPLDIKIDPKWNLVNLESEIYNSIEKSADSLKDAFIKDTEVLSIVIGVAAGKKAIKYLVNLICKEDTSETINIDEVEVILNELVHLGFLAFLGAAAFFGLLAGLLAGFLAELHCCFIEGTLIAMADGRYRRIEDVQLGDNVLGENGEINTVTHIYRPSLGSRKLYSFNGGEYFVTSEHPFKTKTGWRSIEPAATMRETSLLVVEGLTLGDQVLMHDGQWVTLQSIDAKEDSTDTRLYNFELADGHTYIANGYIVHNKDGGDEKNLKKPTGINIHYVPRTSELKVSWDKTNDPDISFKVMSRLKEPSISDSLKNQYSFKIELDDHYCGSIDIFIIAEKGKLSSISDRIQLTRLPPPTDIELKKIISEEISNDQLQITWADCAPEYLISLSIEDNPNPIIQHAIVKSNAYSLNKDVNIFGNQASKDKVTLNISIVADNKDDKSVIASSTVKKSLDIERLKLVTGITKKRKDENIHFTWNLVNNSTSYQIAISTPSQPSPNLQDPITFEECDFPLLLSKINGQYNFMIRATNKANKILNGDWTNHDFSLALNAEELVEIFKKKNKNPIEIGKLLISNLSKSLTSLSLVQAMHTSDYSYQEADEALESAFPDISIDERIALIKEVYGKVTTDAHVYFTDQSYETKGVGVTFTEKSNSMEFGFLILEVNPSIKLIFEGHWRQTSLLEKPIRIIINDKILTKNFTPKSRIKTAKDNFTIGSLLSSGRNTIRLEFESRDWFVIKSLAVKE